MQEERPIIGLLFANGTDRRLLAGFLKEAGFAPRPLSLSGVAPAAWDGVDLFLTDPFCTKRFGEELLRRKKTSPLILPLLIALPGTTESRYWLNFGFDDCLRLPTSRAELEARLRVLLRLRRQSRAILQKSETTFRALVESSADHIFMLSPDGFYLSSNDRTGALGFSSGNELIGKHLCDVYPPTVAELYGEKMSEVLSRGESITFEHDLTRGDEDYYHLDTLFPIFREGKIEAVGGLCRDITERKQLEEGERRLATAIEHLAESVIVTDAEAKILYVNPACEGLTGYGREELIGENPRILKSGEQDEAFYQELWSTLLAGKTWTGFMVNRKKDGEHYEEEATISPVANAEGKITHYIAVKRDVTEERRHREHLQQVQKMEAIGTLAGGIAHDFNNILSAIIGYADLARTTTPKDSPQQEYLQEIFQASGRARELVRQILTFSRAGEGGQKPVDILPVLKETLKLLRASLPSTLEIRTRLEMERAVVLTDPTRIHQIVMNLCTNAAQAVGDATGMLEVILQEKVLTDPLTLRFKELKPGRYVQLSVVDTGEGIAPEILDKIFEPYFTTREPGKGTGLGLAMVHGIVQSCGGALTVYSEPGRGTTFHVYLPLLKTAGVSDGPEKERSLPVGSERILFVDDEETLATLGKTLLKRIGYTVTATTSSLDALERFRRTPEEFDLVITDLTMPEMRGDQLAGELVKIREGIPVILCTGFSKEMTEKETSKIGVRKYLMKPMTLPELADAVREVLDAKVPS